MNDDERLQENAAGVCCRQHGFRVRVEAHEMSGNSAAVGPLGGPPPGMGKLAGSHSSGSSMLLLSL